MQMTLQINAADPASIRAGLAALTALANGGENIPEICAPPAAPTEAPKPAAKPAAPATEEKPAAKTKPAPAKPATAAKAKPAAKPAPKIEETPAENTAAADFDDDFSVGEETVKYTKQDVLTKLKDLAKKNQGDREPSLAVIKAVGGTSVGELTDDQIQEAGKMLDEKLNEE